MTCEKIRQHLPMLAAKRLEGQAADAIHEHLAHCADCQSRLDKTRRLQMLLKWKRHEQPGDLFFRGYLAEFHQRLYASMIQRKSFWSRVREALEFNPLANWAFRGACVTAAIVFVLAIIHVGRTPQGSVVIQQTTLSSPRSEHLANSGTEVPTSRARLARNEMVFADAILDEKTVYVLDRVAYHPAAHETVVLNF